MKTKRITGLILAICLLFTMTPLTFTRAAETLDGGPVTEVSTRDALQEALDAGETAKLGLDIEGSVTVTTGAVLDLNGFVLRGGITVNGNGSLKLIDSDPSSVHESITYTDQIDGTVYEVYGGVVTGGVVKVNPGGQFYMEAGTLAGNSGIWVDRGTAVMSGGMIAGNLGGRFYYPLEAEYLDAEAVLVEGEGGSFTMKGGSIVCNAGSDYVYNIARYGHDLEYYLQNDFTRVCVAVCGGAVFNMEGGTIARNVNGYGGGVCIADDGIFNLIDGSISENVAACGGGVYMYGGTFNMSGGSLDHNAAICESGGGLCGWGALKWNFKTDENGDAFLVLPITLTVIITGGSITGNSAKGGGGGIGLPCIYRFEMSGASITDNTAGGEGGGISLAAVTLTLDGVNVVSHYAGEFELKDSIISGNTAGGKGGGLWVPDLTNPEVIYTDPDPRNGFNGTIHLQKTLLNMSGSLLITGNTSGSDGAKVADNVYLSGEPCITVNGDLTGSSIGVTTEKTPTAEEPVVFTNGLSGKGFATDFFSDDPTYGVKLDDDKEAMLGFFTYDVTVADSEHGSVAATAAGTSSLSGLEAGTLITLGVNADQGYDFDKLTVKMGDKDVAVDSLGNGKYTFEMPAADVVVSATFKLQLFQIDFVDEDNKPLQSGSVAYGETPSYTGETPTKSADAQYTYTFAGWTDGTNTYDKNDTLPAVSGAVTYTAVYTKTKNSYTIIWQQDDGTEIDRSTVEYGQTPTHADPTKDADAEFTYTFAGWSPAIVPVTGDATYKATYTGTTNSYTIIWQQDDGTEIDRTTVEYGQTPTHADPVKEASAEFTYTFAGWSPALVPVTGDATYKATYTGNTNSYTIIWQQDDGTEIDRTTVEYGQTPAHSDPEKEADAQYTYTFAGWDPEISAVTGEATYKATYSSTVNEYTVTFRSEDGTLLQTVTVAYGETPEYTGETPAKAEDAENTYTFAGWDQEISAVTGETEYTAMFTATPKTLPPATGDNGLEVWAIVIIASLACLAAIPVYRKKRAKAK